MLEELHVRDLALIREAWLELGPGLNVLSGETGAGKTVLVEALQLLVGERADSTLVRAGAEEALVEGRFAIDGAERTARRRVSAEGRSRCYLDDGMASVGELAQELGSLVDLHGQHDHQALLRPAAHAGYLERFAGEEASSAHDAYRKAHADSARARGQVAELEDTLAAREQQRDFLAFKVEEIDAVDPRAGEDDELESALPRMRHGERLAEAAASAHRALADDEGAAADRLAEAMVALRSASGIDPDLDSVATDLGSLAAELDDVGTRLRRYADTLEHDPAALNATEARLAMLAALKRKYGPALGDVLAARDEAAEALAELETGDDRLAALRARANAADSDLEAAARDYATALEGAVGALASGLAEAAADLAMGASRFELALETLSREAWTADTPVRVEFLFSSSAGDPPRPLAKVASGGEVSRVMLALKSVLGKADTTPVLVFDEVDAGIGGATAVAVGARLAELSRGRQVIVVTHLAQVAAFADRHLVVSKDDEGDRAVTTVRRVESDERVAELARMLAGSDSVTGLAHARELLASVGAGV